MIAWPAAAQAHGGAPYLVLLDEPLGPYLASALADPDVGGGTFYILVTQAGGEPVAAGTQVTLWAAPEDGHLAESAYPAEHRQTRYGERFVAEVPFDAEGAWRMRLVVDGPAGEGQVSFPVQVTPAGGGWLVTVLCLLPFVAAGLLWLRATLRQQSRIPPGPGQEEQGNNPGK